MSTQRRPARTAAAAAEQPPPVAVPVAPVAADGAGLGGRAALAEDRGLSRFSPIRARKASDEVLAVLVDALRGGMYETGDALPPERELAQQLNVSRKVLREAVERLRAEGIVSVRRGAGGGTIIESVENLAEVCASIQGETRASLRSILEVRRSVECTGALLAAQRADDAQLALLHRLLLMLDDVVDNPKEFWEIDLRFHVGVAEASGNPFCERFLREIINQLSVIRQHFPYAHVPHGQAIHNQRKTFEALVSRDPDRVLQSMDEHLGDLEYVMLGARLTVPELAATLPYSPEARGR